MVYSDTLIRFFSFHIYRAGLVDIAVYIVSLVALLVLFYGLLAIKLRKFGPLRPLITKEFFQQHNASFAVFLGAKFLSLALIISKTMLFNLLGMIIFAIAIILIQEAFVRIFARILGVKSLYRYVLEDKSIAVSIFYAFLILGVTLLLTSTLS